MSSGKSMTSRLGDAIFHAGLRSASRWALALFEQRLSHARAVNQATLLRLLRAGSQARFGRDHQFERWLHHNPLEHAYRANVPLRSYAGFGDYIDRVAASESAVLTSTPTAFLARTAGTTAAPKLIPRTRRSQWDHMTLAVLAEQAVIGRNIPIARQSGRGISLMTSAGTNARVTAGPATVSGPNAGVKRLRSVLSRLYVSPEPAFRVADQQASLYVHALFALRHRDSLFIVTPFAPRVLWWVGLMAESLHLLVDDLKQGTLSASLRLSVDERDSLTPFLKADPERADEVARAWSQGEQGIIERLWPGLAYINTITTGSFAVAAARLSYLAGPRIAIQSATYAASEGILGINLGEAGSTAYALAIGASYFEFIPSANIDEDQPATIDVTDVVVGESYEVVMTTDSGLYRYRLGDVVRVAGFIGQAPTVEVLYRRGTILNLVGDKMTEDQTQRAVSQTIEALLGGSGRLRDFSVEGSFVGNRAQYVFYVEVVPPPEPGVVATAGARLDEALCDTNPYYRINGREPDRLAPAHLCFVQPGTFDRLADYQLRQGAGVTQSQLKTPRVVRDEAQLAILRAGALDR
jgi:hypothetical protein